LEDTASVFVPPATSMLTAVGVTVRVGIVFLQDADSSETAAVAAATSMMDKAFLICNVL
jgi:hypothetical protein